MWGMGTNNIDELKVQLRGLGFDSRVDAALETAFKGDLPNFNLLYKDEQKEKGLYYHIYFSKNDRSSAYQITRFATFLEREIKLSHALINGINTAALENKLSGFDWSTYRGGRENHAVVESFRNDLTILSQTKLGRKAAELLIAKYWPTDMPVAERDRYLTFDAFRDTFCLHKVSPANGSWTAHLVYDLIKSRMDDFSQLKNIHNCALTIEAEVVNTQTNVTGRSNIVFETLTDAFASLDTIDFRLFDKDFIAENKLPCHIKKLNVIDTFDNVVIASKTIEFKTNPSPQESPVKISFEINEEKMNPLDFIREVNLDVNKSFNKQSMYDIKYLLSTYNLSGRRENNAQDVKAKPPLKKGRGYPGH
jgi:hypothetical protein